MFNNNGLEMRTSDKAMVAISVFSGIGAILEILSAAGILDVHVDIIDKLSEATLNQHAQVKLDGVSVNNEILILAALLAIFCIYAGTRWVDIHNNETNVGRLYEAWQNCNNRQDADADDGDDDVEDRGPDLNALNIHHKK